MSPAGKKAAQRARMAIERQGLDPDLLTDLVDQYARAVDDVDHLRSAWNALGRPAMTDGGATGKAEVAHPLIRQIHEAEKLAASLAENVGLTIKSKRGPGRPVASDRAMPPKLSVVKRA